MIGITYFKIYNRKIKFTMEHSFKELPFLDILIKNQNSQIIINHSHPTMPPFQKSLPTKLQKNPFLIL